MKKLLEKKMNDRFVGVFPLEFEEQKSSAIPDTIHLIPIGQWEHDLYGPILINNSDIREFAQNFNASIRKGVFITAGHEGFDELPAVGWITEVQTKDDGLWGTVEWNKLGKATLSDKQFKFFSPEFYRDYEDPQTHQIYRNVITGGALTKAPYFKELEAIMFSEPKLRKQFNETNNNTMDLNTIVAKKVEDLTVEEKAFLKDHKAELTDEQKTAFTAVIDEPETDEDKTTREAKEKADKDAADETAKGDANEAAGLNRDGSTKVQASEKVMISAGELAALTAKANAGAQAFAELEKTKLDTAVAGMLFSESNKTGKFLPKSKDNLRAFLETLNAAQRTKFSELLTQLPKSDVFSEKGEGSGATEGTAVAEFDTKVKAKMSEDKNLTYADASKAVFSENPGLDQRYTTELPNARKAQA